MTVTTKVALVGCGGWGKNLARNLAELGGLQAIVDPSPAAHAIAEQLGVETTELDRVLGDEGIAGLVIATPATTHFELAEAAMRAGKDVFIEKPIALELADAEKLRSTAEELGRVLMVGHLLQYHPVFVYLLDHVRSGGMGKVRHIISSRMNFGVLRSYENVLWSFAPHDISMVLALAGREPEKVLAQGSTVLQAGIPDITSAYLRFGDGLTATITSSWLHPEKEQKLIVIGEQGMAVFDDRKPWAEKLAFYRNRVDWTGAAPKAVAAEAEYPDIDQGEPLQDEMTHFLISIRDRTKPRTDAVEAIQVLRVLQSAQKALDNPDTTVPLTAEVGTGGAATGYVAHPSAIVDRGVEIGQGTRIWHFSHVLGGSKIGDNCVIGQNVMIGPDVTVGTGCKIQNNVAIYKGVVLEDDVFCGPSMVFTNVLTPRAHVERKEEFAPTLIGKGATLGANCTIVCGHNVGRYAMIGAGAVVTKNVTDHALVVGNPARQIGWVSRAGERLGENLICPRTGEIYDLAEDGRSISLQR